MRSRPKGHAAVGIACALLGAAAIMAGVVRPFFLAGQLLGTPAWALTITAGGVLALTGVLILLFSFRPAPEEPNIVPAHVAFKQRMIVQPVVPASAQRPSVPGSGSAEDGGASSSASRLPAPAAQAKQRVGPIKEDIAGIDDQIRDLTKRINKAGVMLATGQLSQQGYLAYVEDLKSQRGKLEAARVRAELRST